MKPPHRRVFHMPPAFTPKGEQLEQSGAGVIHDSELHIPVRVFLRLMEEVMTTISELSSNVDRLISVATDIKNRSDNQASQAASIPADDPEVAALNDKITKAIDVLTGNVATSGANSPAGAPPEAPVDNSAAQATSIDPNAPAVTG